jgi:chaperone required for assembly of F1-ATPase
MKRIYRHASAGQVGEHWRIFLDGRPLSTPARRLIELSSEELARAVAAEWESQADDIKPNSMPLMQLLATALDSVEPNRGQVIGAIAEFAETDLVCYRAERPAELVARQQAVWQPLVDWAILRFDAPFTVTSGVMPRPQPPATIAAVRSAVSEFDNLSLTALHSATVSCGSVIIGLALVSGHVDSQTAWQASQLDEAFQAERWGEDAEVAARRAALRAELEAASAFNRLL